MLVIASEAISTVAMINKAVRTIRRTPKRFMKAAANGPMRPNRANRIASAEEISDGFQPNSFSSGTINTPGAPTAPAVTSMVRNVATTTAQP